MSRTVIQVEGLGKRYRIGQAKQHNALSHVIGDALRAPLRLLGRVQFGAHANGASAGPSASSSTRARNHERQRTRPTSGR